MVFCLSFSNNTILSSLFLFFLYNDSYFFIPAVITQSFNPTSELAVPIGITVYEANKEIETQTLAVETKISNCTM